MITPDRRREILVGAMQTYGEAAQTNMMIEEMSELMQALLKVRRLTGEQMGSSLHHARVVNVREEIADVQIMLDQMRLIYGDTGEIETEKLQRLAHRLYGEPVLAEA